MDSGLIESETHPAPVVQNYNLRIFVINNDYMRITINYGNCYHNLALLGCNFFSWLQFSRNTQLMYDIFCKTCT